MFVTFKEFLKAKGLEPQDEKRTAEELAGLYNEYNEESRKNLESLVAEKSEENKELIAQAKTEIAETQKKQLENLNDVLKQQGLAIKTFSRGGVKEDENLSFGESLRKNLNSQLEVLKSIKKNPKSGKETVNFDIAGKAMTIGGNVSGGNVPVEDRIEGFNRIPSRQIRLLDVMSKRNTTSNIVSWVYQANQTGTTGQTGEGLLKNEIAFDLVVANEAVKKTTNFIKVSTEMLDDIEWIASEIEAELMQELLKAVEQTTYDGDGTGNNHNGITTVASSFVAGPFAGTVDNANVVDVLTVARDNINVNQEGLEPDYIFMYPSDVAALALIKVDATDKRYVDRLQNVNGMLSLDGVPIIKSTLVAQGDYLIGNFTKSLSVTRQGVNIDIGLDADDFSKNLRTILAEWRGLTIVKNNDRSAFVYGTIATDAAALETA